jgi:hypothetical protein
MARREGHPFTDFELMYLSAVEAWRTRLLEDPTPLTREERGDIAEFLTLALQDFLDTGPHEHFTPEELGDGEEA